MKLGISLFNIALSAVVGLYRTWAIALGWAWFVQPAFGIAVPNFWMLYGILSVYQLATFKSLTKADFLAENEYKKQHGEHANALYLFLNNLVFALAITFTLVVMWIVKEVAF